MCFGIDSFTRRPQLGLEVSTPSTDATLSTPSVVSTIYGAAVETSSRIKTTARQAATNVGQHNPTCGDSTINQVFGLGAKGELF